MIHTPPEQTGLTYSDIGVCREANSCRWCASLCNSIFHQCHEESAIFQVMLVSLILDFIKPLLLVNNCALSHPAWQTFTVCFSVFAPGVHRFHNAKRPFITRAGVWALASISPSAEREVEIWNPVWSSRALTPSWSYQESTDAVFKTLLSCMLYKYALLSFNMKARGKGSLPCSPGRLLSVSECHQRIRLWNPLTRDLHRPPAVLGQRPQKVPLTRTSDLVADHARMLVPFYPRSHPRPCRRTGKSTSDFCSFFPVKSVYVQKQFLWSALDVGP